jgi:hypothetical protein
MAREVDALAGNVKYSKWHYTQTINAIDASHMPDD